MGIKYSFQEAKDIVLSASYEALLGHSDYDTLSTEDIHKRVDEHFAPGFIQRVLSSLSHERLIEVEQYDESSSKRYTLTDEGFERVEKLPQLSLLLKLDAKSAANTDVVPAADRLVTIDHNKPEVIEISEGLEAVSDAFRGVNSGDIDEVVRSRLRKSLEAAKTLWESRELKVIQVNVGIVMVLEEIQTYLKDTAKAASVAGLIELIKIFLLS